MDETRTRRPRQPRSSSRELLGALAWWPSSSNGSNRSAIATGTRTASRVPSPVCSSRTICAALVRELDEVAARVRHEQLERRLPRAASSAIALAQRVEPLAGQRRDEHGARVAGAQRARGPRRRAASILLKTSSCGLSAAPISPSTSRTARICSRSWACAGVDDVQQQVGLAHLVERGLERLDEPVRQLVDEADGVGERDLAALGQLEAARRRVERGEQLVVRRARPRR